MHRGTKNQRGTKMKKTMIILTIISLLILSACTNNTYNNNNYENNSNNTELNNNEKESNKENNNEEYGLKEFNDCLADNGVVIYGSEWCPACRSLVQSLGGYEAVTSVYVECTKEQQRCTQTKTNYVPEIQINKEVYEGSRSIKALAEITRCKTP